MGNLQFQNHQITVMERDGKAWLKSVDIARALGYTRTDKLTQVYDRHSAEFTSSMTLVTRSLSLGHGVPQMDVRWFSLRGAHLLGMFSRTKKGADFRHWVLDQLDALERQNIPQHSLMVEWFDAKAALDNQDRFASMCGKGLNEHKQRKPPLLQRVNDIMSQIQPQLFLS